MSKFLIEHSYDIEVLEEAREDGKPKDLFIEGIFLQADVKNRNGRIYPKHIMEKEVHRYMKEAVAMKNAYGELDHPAGPKINPDRISHLITDLRMEGSNFVGKAKILNTPMGNIARSILESGGKLAVSSRGLGSLKRSGDAMVVQEDFYLATAADIVINPSAPDAYVESIMESPDWYWNNATNEWELKQIMEELKDTTKSQITEEFAIDLVKRLANAIISGPK